MYSPDLESFCRLAEDANLVPVYRDLPADLETPVSLFLKLRTAEPSFLLESVEGGEQLGRYSFLGTAPSLVVQACGTRATLHRRGETPQDRDLGGRDPLHLIEELLAEYRTAPVPGLPRFFGGAVGYLAYDTVRHFERLPECDHDELGLPDATMLFTDTLVIFDHVTHRMKLVANARIDGDPRAAYTAATARIDALAQALCRPLSPETSEEVGATSVASSDITSNFTREEFCEKVERCKEYIAAGDAFQIVFSQRLRRKTVASPFSIYRALRMVNPSPYMFFLDFGDFQLIGSSPEALVKLEEGRAETHPIAGTRRRGATPDEDVTLEAELLADPKERAEHIMLVDLGRNDLGRVCEYGTVRPTRLMEVGRFSHVMHIVSIVEGQIRPDKNAFDLIRAAFPAGTVSGAPKVRAMEIINELEATRRGPYAGAVGYFSFTGNMDTCIALRTIVMVGDTVYVQAGGGIVADSVPEDEYQESLNKGRALSRAVELAEELYCRRPESNTVAAG